MSAMERSSIKRLALKTEGFEIELEKETFGHSNQVTFPPKNVPEIQEERAPSFSSPPLETPILAASSYIYITSPMVGTFYSSSSPEDPSFVKIGDSVEEETVVCIIEAMKVMNEMKSQLQGKIIEALVKNGDPVEFGTKIFRIEK